MVRDALGPCDRPMDLKGVLLSEDKGQSPEVPSCRIPCTRRPSSDNVTDVEKGLVLARVRDGGGWGREGARTGEVSAVAEQASCVLVARAAAQIAPVLSRAARAHTTLLALTARSVG